VRPLSRREESRVSTREHSSPREGKARLEGDVLKSILLLQHTKVATLAKVHSVKISRLVNTTKYV